MRTSAATTALGGVGALRPDPTDAVPGAPERLADWLGVLARPYRAAMAAIVVLNLLSAATTFVELELLRALTVVLSRPPSAADAGCTLGAWAHAGFSIAPEPCGARLPFLLLTTYTAIVLLQGGLDYAGLAVNARLSQAARRDIERELVRNLLLQDDAFFLRRAPAEILSRLGGDLQRVGARRQMVMQGIATALSVVAVVWVLAMQSAVAAVVGVLVSMVGVLASQPLLGRLRELDGLSIETDDRVKTTIEDTLGGVAEIQVSALAPKMLASLAARQTVRDAVAVRNADVNNLNASAQRLTFSVSFIAVLILFAATEIFGPLARDDGGLDRAALIVLLISTLPQLYFKIGELTQLVSHFQVSGLSLERLAQYEAPRRPARARIEAGSQGSIALRAVRYQFGPGAPVLGGPGGISCEVSATGLTGLVGPSGAGKSTLTRLILGRQDAIEGSVVWPPLSDGGGPRFVYLPQRPVVFDGTLRDNLLLATPEGNAALVSRAPVLDALGLNDLVRRKGLDAFPTPDAAVPDGIGALRAALRAQIEAMCGEPIRPLGPDSAAPRQFVIEAQLGLAVDQGALARRLVSPLAREPVRRLAATAFGGAVAALGLMVLRRTVPLLTQAATPEDYDRISAVRIEPEVWQLRSRAVELAATPPQAATHPLLVAVGLTVRLEEVVDGWPLNTSPEVPADLSRLVEGIASPLDADRINPLLTWRENLVFGSFDGGNANRLAALDRALIAAVAGTPLDALLRDSGLAFGVGRGGGRLSGGQQQLVALGRALLSPAPFVVLDEPSSALHPQLRADVIAVLTAEAQRRAVLVITHDMDLARACDRLLFVKDGALAAEGAWDALVRSDPAFQAWVGSAAEAVP